jgi:hypothetical protein
MKTGLVLALACSALCACLTSANIGEFDVCDGGCSDAQIEQGRRDAIVALIEDLTRGTWRGKATGAGSMGMASATCTFRFRRDGGYQVLGDGSSRDFMELFFTARNGQVDGRYTITDELQGQFFGEFTDLLFGVAPWVTTLSYLELQGDRLTFSRRTALGDYGLNTTELVLQRQR